MSSQPDDPGNATAYVTDTTRSLTRTAGVVSVRGDKLSAQLAPRSLTTMVLR